MSKRILVVEDQPDGRQIIRDMLAPTDYAPAAIAKQRPDLILMDTPLRGTAHRGGISPSCQSYCDSPILNRSVARCAT